MAQTDWQTPKKYGFRTGWGLGQLEDSDLVTSDQNILPQAYDVLCSVTGSAVESVFYLDGCSLLLQSPKTQTT